MNFVTVVSPALDFGFLRVISMPLDPSLHTSSVHFRLLLSFCNRMPHPVPHPSLHLFPIV